MGTNKLPDFMLSEMDSYVDGLPGDTPSEKADNYDRQDGYRAVFNPIEDFWNKQIVITTNYTVPEAEGGMTIILNSSGVTADVAVTLPDYSTNIGRRLVFINRNSGYRLRLISTGVDSIEHSVFSDPFATVALNPYPFGDIIELIGTSFGWHRIRKTFSLIPDVSRPAGYVLNGGSSTTWADVSFNTWVQDGVFKVLIRYIILHVGNSSVDYSIFHFRPKDGTVDNFFKNVFGVDWFTNLTTGFTSGSGGQLVVDCNPSGIIQYRQFVDAQSGNGTLFLTIEGYWK